jgi:5-formyltetrahydrofolate cyclo-ligase
VEHTKANLRESIRSRRKVSQSHFNLSLLSDSPEFKSSAVIASYRSFGDEPNTEKLNQLILESGKKLLLPVRLPDNSLEFRIWDGDPAKLERSGKVEEPIGERFLGQIDLIIVPALAIDSKGNRLGQGGGSYDRTLRDFSGVSIGLVNEDEFVRELPIESHDMPVKMALTPTRLVRI